MIGVLHQYILDNITSVCPSFTRPLRFVGIVVWRETRCVRGYRTMASLQSNPSYLLQQEDAIDHTNAENLS